MPETISPPAEAQRSAQERRADRIRLAQLMALSFTALFLELMVIRWVPCVIRFVAYYANLLLISSFLGLGIGAMISRRQWKIFGWFPLLLAINIGVILACQPVTMPGSDSEVRFYVLNFAVVSYAILSLIFVLNAILFVPLGERIGTLFEELPNLRAYSWDLLGSLLGTLAFGFFSLRFFSPTGGFAVVMMIFLLLAQGRTRAWALALFLPTLAGVYISQEPGARWSPYHYITVHDDEGLVLEPLANVRTMKDPPIYSVRVNQDFYQQHGTINPARYTPGTEQEAYVRTMLTNAYMLPYEIHPDPEDVLVVGAGGGLDVEAALLAGADEVDAAEIDEELVGLSRRYSASGVYDDPRVKVHINDARAFFREAKPGYDVVIFGFLDSQALFSYGSNIRLDGYIYTVESIRTAWNLLDEDGMLSISFVTPEPWLASKLHRMVKEATGREPIAYAAGIQLVLLAPKLPPPSPPPSEIGRFVLVDALGEAVEAPTDDWPYLYLSEPEIPADYLLVIGTLILLSLGGVLLLRKGGIGLEDGHFFFMGAGFLLLQTKAISDCALYFGATWFVTMLVIAGVLLMVLLANLVAIRWRSYSPWLYMPLIAVIIVLLVVPRDTVLGWSFSGRLLWTMLAVPLPVFFAGLIFSTTFRTAANPSSMFGSNLIGATVGGFAEYLSMATGLNALSGLVIGMYLASAICYTAYRRLRG